MTVRTFQYLGYIEGGPKDITKQEKCTFTQEGLEKFLQIYKEIIVPAIDDDIIEIIYDEVLEVDE